MGLLTTLIPMKTITDITKITNAACIRRRMMKTVIVFRSYPFP